MTASPVAIIGLGLRLPQADDLATFWRALENKQSLIRTAPPQRWDPTSSGLAASAVWGGFLDDADCFDASFFGISPREANLMDPQQRFALEMAWHAIEDAGYAATDLAGSRTGVFMGVCHWDYAELLEKETAELDAYQPTGIALSAIANRISYHFDFHGPSIANDTACASSLTAIYEAVRAIQSGDCGMALAGGVNLCWSPNHFIAFSKAGMLSKDGSSKAFDAGANGYVRGEGGAVFLLKPLDHAMRDGDPIHAVIRAVRVNHGGRTNSLTVTNPDAQADLIVETMRSAGIPPESISYVEAHGPGTPLGDPIEIAGLKTAFARLSNGAAPEAGRCTIGSVKANIGHLEGAAAAAGLAKIIAAFHAGTLPGHARFERLNPLIDFSGSPFRIQEETEAWVPPPGTPRRAALSSFGFAGSNGHIIVEEAPQPSPEIEHGPCIIPVSARNEDRLRALVASLLRFIDGMPGLRLQDLAMTLQQGRIAMDARVAFHVASLAELRQAAQAYLDGHGNPAIVTADAAAADGAAKLAAAWIAGQSIAWPRMPGARRIHVPLYPFARQRFWFDRTRAGKDQASVPHPLLHRNRSGLGAIVYESHFRGDEFFFAEHVAGGQQILPGTVALEMARAAAALDDAAAMQPALRLTDVTWLRPIAHHPGGIDVTLRMERGGPGDLTFSIAANGSEPAVSGKLHAGAGAADIAPLPAPASTTPREPSSIYERLRAMGMQHGPVFRLIRSVESNGSSASVGLQLGRLQAGTLNTMALHPLLLDAAIQAWTAVHPELAGGAAVPFSCRALHVLAPCTAKMQATVSNANAGQAARSYILLDIDLHDDKGRLCVAMRGLMLRVAGDQAAAAATRQDDGKLALFRSAWLELPRWSGDVFQGARVLLAGFSEDEAALLRKDLPHPAEQLAFEDGLAAGAALLLESCAQHVAAIMKAGGTTPVLVAAHPHLGAPTAAALAGLLRTAAAEQPRLAVSLIRFAPDCDMTQVARGIIAELDRDDLAGEILIDGTGLRRARTPETTEAMPKSITLDPAAAYWVTGGLGGAGLHFAEWLASKGAQHIVLSGRSAAAGAKARGVIEALASRGVTVTSLACDVTDHDAVHRTVARIEQDIGPLRGIIHAAGILEDALLLTREKTRTARVLAPKLPGTVNLDEATRQLDLDFFILTSSIAGTAGNPGQADYAGANAFLDGYAEWREEQRRSGKRQGRSLSIAWPLWADGGMTVSPQGREALRRRFGTEPLPTAAAFRALDMALAHDEPRLLVHYGDQADFVRLMQLQRRARAHASSKPHRDDGGSRHAAMAALVRDMLGAQLQIEPSDIRTDRPLSEYGLDSIAIVETTNRLEERLGPLPKTLFFEYVDINGAASYLAEHHGDALAEAGAPEAPAISRAAEPDPADAAPPRGKAHAVAIVGMSLRVAKAADVDAFWGMLSRGEHGFTVVPHDRWDHAAVYHPERDVPGKTVVRTGAFLDGIDRFDPRYFRISQREAELMAPEVRLFLQASVEAFESAGYSRETLHRKFRGDVAVIASSMTNEYDLYGFQNMLVRGAPASGSYTGTLPNMVSYFYGLTGPSYFLDTMCSAASTCVHEAVHMLRSGRCAMALAGAVNLLLHPQKLIATSQEHFTSKSADVIRGYGLGADGTILGEGVGALVLKRLEDAERDNDTILGVIIGTGISNAGVRNGFTVPNPQQQAAAIEAALADATIDPRSIAYVEGHGSGTSLGDPIEVRALSQVWQKHGAGVRECPLGTVKGNVAHLLGASGLAGIVKVLLQLKHGELAPSLHADTLNPNIPFAQTPFYVQRERGPWPVRHDAQGRPVPLRAGITSIGAGGMNAHIIVEAYRPRARKPAEDHPQLFCFSALTPKTLHALLERMRAALTAPDAPAADDAAYTLQVGRNALPCRLAVIAGSLAELATRLGDFLAKGALTPSLVYVENSLTATPWPEQTANSALAGSDLPALARAWAEGTDIDWERLPRSRAPRRVALPLYPFEQVRCWYPSFDDAPSVTAPLGSSLKLHPLVGSNVSDVSGLRFDTRIILEELLDYSLERGRSRELLSTAVLELPLAAARCAGLQGPLQVMDLRIGTDLPAQPWERLDIRVTPGADGVTVTASAVAAGKPVPWLTAEVSAGAAPDAPHISSDVAPGDAQAFYAGLRSRGHSFAPFLECLSGIWRAPGIAYGQLRLDGPQQDHHKKNVSLPPQALAAIAQLILADDPDAETAAVAGLGRLVWSEGAATRVFMQRRARGVYDLSGLDDRGAACWTIHGLRTHAAAAAEPQADQAPRVEAGGVAAELTSIAAELLKFPVADIDPHALFHELGFDSISLARYASEIGAAIGVDLSPAAFFEFGSIDALARHLGERASSSRRAQPASLPRAAVREPAVKVAPPPLPAVSTSGRSEIAIIGMAGRFPGAPDVDSFFDLLLAGADLTGPLPLDRYGPDYRKRFETASFKPHGGFLADVDRFDAAFFRISPYEAQRMDPQQRLLLETAWRALEDAGYRPEDLPKGTGVFAGVSATDYSTLLAAHGVPADGQVATGNSLAMVANRLSYVLDINGPSESIDTACSSSLVALLRASDALRSGRCPVAIVGGVHLALSFEGFEGPQRAGMLGATGRCQSFGASADGYARGEGVVALVIKPRHDAERDGDRILALIAGGAENHGGRAGALTAPSVNAQAALIRAACAGLDLSGLGMIEAHGTGTALGDPVEVNALKAALADLPEGSIALGSVKSNIGHLEAAAGLAGVVKAVQALRRRRIPPTLHAAPMNPLLEIAGTPFRLAAVESAWPPAHDGAGRPVPRMAGVSSFGFGGANAHVVLREHVSQLEPRRTPLAPRNFAATRFWIPGVAEPAPLVFSPAWTPAAPAGAGSPPANRHVMLGGYETDVLTGSTVRRLPSFSGPVFERARAAAQWMAEQLSAIMREAGSAPRLVQWVSPAGGDDTIARGLAAMLRTAALEDHRIIPQIHLIEGPIPAGGLDALLAREAASSAPCELLHRDGARFLRAWRESPLARGGPAVCTGRVIVVTGALGGLGRLVAEAIARDGHPAALVLTGRRDLSGPDAAWLARLKAHAPETHYVRCDVTRQEEADALAALLRGRWGRVDTVLHAAGTLADKMLTGMPPDALARVFAPKLEGAHRLIAALRGLAPRDIVLFSSIAAIAGNTGQAAYSAANACLAALAEGTSLPVRVVHWPLWRDGGMGVDEATSLSLARRMGQTPLDSAQGLAVLWSVLERSIPECAVMAGEAARIRAFFGNFFGETDPGPRTAQLPPGPALVNRVEERLRAVLAEIAGLSASAIDAQAPLTDYGIDSLMIVRINERLERDFGRLPRSLLFQHRTLADLAQHLAETRREAATAWAGMGAGRPEAQPAAVQAVPAALPERPSGGREPIAIIGLSAHLPGAGSLEAFWQLLLGGQDAITEIPAERWPLEGFYEPDPASAAASGRSYSKWGGFLDSFADFDPAFFRIAPREAACMDPQERQFLMCAWEALEDAGYSRARIAAKLGGRVGVYAGVTKTGYEKLAPFAIEGGAMAQPGISFASVANRVSHVLGVSGPSLPVDTMCSSSLTAIHIACEHLRSGACGMAIAGGVNLYLHPSTYVELSAARMLSPTGQCHTFGGGADGFVPGEGVGCVILKPLSRALADGDRIHAVIRGSAINHGGASNGYTVPNPDAQRDVIRAALADAGVAPGDITYVEAHGTGTRLGDPIEIESLAAALHGRPQDAAPCHIASVKTNIGHLEAAAGIAGLVKILLQMRHRTIAPHRNAATVNPHIDLAATPFRIPQSAQPWQEGRRLAGLSSFGAGGANAHVVIEDWQEPRDTPADNGPQAIILSARDPSRLKEQARALLATLTRESPLSQPAGPTGGSVRLAIAEILGVTPVDVGERDTLSDLGFDSAQLARLRHWLRDNGGNTEGLTIDRTVSSLAPKAGETARMPLRLADIAYTLQVGREAMPDRLAIEARSVAELEAALEAFIAGRPSPSVWTGNAEAHGAVLGLISDDLQSAWTASAAAGNLSKLLRLWVAGAAVDWEALPRPQRPEILSLPTYPFARLRLWPSTRPAATAGGLFPDPPGREALAAQEASLEAEIVSLLSAILPDSAAAVQPQYLPWLQAARAMVRPQQGEGLSPEAAWQRWQRFLDGTAAGPLAAQARLAQTTLSALGDILSGRRAATTVMFPEGSMDLVEAVYVDNPVAARFSTGLAEAAARAVGQHIAAKPGTAIRILEVGAGTGGTTAAVLAALAPHANAIGEYCFTDLSRAFLTRAEQRFGVAAPPLSTAVFDAERPPEDQGIAARSWDIVIAANVLHATRDIVATLRNVRGLLRPHGLLLLNETSKATALTHVTFGLLDGWWAHRDSARRIPGTPSLTPSAWRAALEESGFAWLAASPEPEISLGQQLIAARAQDLPRAPAAVPRALGSELPVREAIRRELAAVLGIKPDAIGLRHPISDLGLDSILGMQFVHRINKVLNTSLAQTELYDHATVEALEARLAGEAPAPVITAPPAAAPAAAAPITKPVKEPIAIVGLSGRFAKSDTPEELWRHLAAGRDLVEPVTRFDLAAEYPGIDPSTYGRHGSFIDGIENFDAAFFGITGVEATYMDPQQRLFLEEAWRTLENAGYAGEETPGSRIGIFVGCSHGDYQDTFTEQPPGPAFWGNTISLVPARIAYHLNLKGPAVAVDTACSSSLVAIHLACQSLWNGDSAMAIAGGVFVHTTTRFFRYANQAKMLSASGRCAAFGADADGIVPGEAVAAVLLKPLSAARADGDTIHAVIEAVGVNQDGTTNGISAPSAVSQERLIRETYETFGIRADDIGLLEAHGTGTPLGDPIEFTALSRAFGSMTDKQGYCALGSIKSNIGHATTAAGIAGLVKVLLALRHETIPPTIHCAALNPAIRAGGSPFIFNATPLAWPAGRAARRAAVSSFGFSGTNAHLVLRDEPPAARPELPGPVAIFLSARSGDRLRLMAKALADAVAHDPHIAIRDAAFTLAAGRRHMRHRLAFVAGSRDSLVEVLGSFAGSGQVSAGLRLSELQDGAAPGPERMAHGLSLIETLRTDAAAWTRETWDALAALYCEGAKLPFGRAFAPGTAGRIALPTYPFERRRYWASPPASPARPQRAEAAPALTLKTGTAGISTPAQAPDGRLRLVPTTAYAAGVPADVRVEDGVAILRADSWGPSGTMALEAAAQREDVRVLLIETSAEAADQMGGALKRLPLPLVLATEAPCRRDDTGADFEVSGAGFLAEARELARNIARAPRGSLLELKACLGATPVAPAQDDPVLRLPERLDDTGPSPIREIPVGSGVVSLAVGDDGVAVISLRERQHRNMFTPDFMAGLAAAFEAIGRMPEAKAVILTGFDTYFACGGTREGLEELQRGEKRFTDIRAYTLPLDCALPVIAAMQGHAIGAGWSLGLYCDAQIYAQEAIYHSNYLRLGFTPGAGATLAFPHRLGLRLGSEILFSAREYRGRELAARCPGLLHRPAGEVLSTARAIARHWARQPREQLLAAKQRSAAWLRERIEAALARELDMHARTFIGNAEVKSRIAQAFAGAQPQPPQTARAPDSAIRKTVLATLAEELMIAPGDIRDGSGFLELGLDSILAVTWLRRLGKELQREIPATAVYAHPTVGALIAALSGDAPPPDPQPDPQPEAPAAVPREETTKAPRRVDIHALVTRTLAEELMIGAAEIREGSGFLDLGLDSILALTWLRRLSREMGSDIPATAIYAHPTVGALVNWLSDQASAAAPEAVPPPEAPPVPLSAPVTIAAAPAHPGAIAIIGASGRFPMARDLRAFWSNIAEGRDCITEVPKSRWDIARHYHPDPTHPETSYSKWMGAIDDVDMFDARFFNITPREAELMDPQQRLFLEHAWQAFEDAAIDPARLQGSNCGTFVGAGPSGYASLIREKNAYSLLGSSGSILAARIAHLLDLHGPAVSLDTACSSSLVAIVEACDSLTLGNCDMALAGGACVMIGPSMFVDTSKVSMLSPDGRCFTFDGRANGFVPGEGVGVLLLKRLADAERDGDPVRAIIRGWGTNQDGRTNGITAPNPKAQARLIRRVHERFGITPATIGLVEAHGTGTALGDPIEIEGLTEAFASAGMAPGSCAIGSVKSNIGHLLASAGVAGAIKAMQALEHRQLPPTINFETLNAHIRLDGTPFRVNTGLRDWPAGQSPRRACVSAFGFSGTNAHIVLEEAAPVSVGARETSGPVVIPVSAANAGRLSAQAAALGEELRRNGTLTAADVAITLQAGRPSLAMRAAAICSTREEVIAALDRLTAGRPEGTWITAGAGAGDGGPLHAVAQQWVAGKSVTWPHSPGGRRRHLPAYPFERVRHWVADDAAGETPPGAFDGAEAGDGRLSLDIAGGEPWLAGRVTEEEVFPLGLFIPELARVLAMRSGAEPKVLRHLVWGAPFGVNGRRRTIDVTLDQGADGLSYAVTERTTGCLWHVGEILAGHQMAAEGWNLTPDGAGEDQTAQWRGFAERCAVHSGPPAPEADTVRAVTRQSGRLTAALRKSRGARAGAIDAFCLETVWRLVTFHLAPEGDGRLLFPHAVGRLGLLAPISDDAVVVIERNDSPQGPVLRIALTDQAGTPGLLMEDVIVCTLEDLPALQTEEERA